MAVYRTISGDNWDMIALKKLGDEMFVSQLIQANRQHIGTVIFPAGIVLNLPEATAPTNLLLPPWKRGYTNG